MIFPKVNFFIHDKRWDRNKFGVLIDPPVLLLPTILIERRRKTIRRFKLEDGTRGSMIVNGIAFSVWWFVWQVEIVVFPKRWNTGLYS